MASNQALLTPATTGVAVGSLFEDNLYLKTVVGGEGRPILIDFRCIGEPDWLTRGRQKHHPEVMLGIGSVQ